jgi:5'-nucleotidase / UDP-sugar diphosphatase
MRIYHTSDLHDRRGFADSLIPLRAAKPGWYFDCGDSLRGSQTVYHRNEPILRELDRAGCDAQAIGNREFHYLFGALAARAGQMRHPLVCSNLTDLRARALPFLDHVRLANPHGALYLAGLLVVQYPPGSRWERVFGWRFLDPVATIERHARQVSDNEYFIVLSHLGLAADRKLAACSPRIDLLLGGHSHDTLAQPCVVGDVPIVHAGPYGRFASLTELHKEGGRSVLDHFELVPLHGGGAAAART